MLKTVKGSILAAIAVAMGGSAFLACDNKYVGSVLFSVALLCICYLGFYLFTGKIGYVVNDYSKKNLLNIVVGLFGNLIVIYLLGLCVRYAVPSLGDKAVTICIAKLNQNFLNTFVRAIFCGVLMFLAVHVYREKNSPLGILFCIPVFILSGFEHSIADAFYFGASGIYDAKILLFELAAVLGNSVGSIVVALLAKEKAAK